MFGICSIYYEINCEGPSTRIEEQGTGGDSGAIDAWQTMSHTILIGH